MKQALALIAPAAMTLLVACNNHLGESDLEKAKIERVKPGMSAKEVVQVLGQPDYISRGHDSLDIYYFYFTNNKVGRSEMPYVHFDIAGIVRHATYADGG